MKIEYYNSDTGCELAETETLINRLEAYLGKIERLRAAEGSPEPTPFHHFLKAMGGFLPSPQARWCTKKMKLDKFEEYVGDDYAVSYVGIRGDEDRDGYISSKPNIQAIFPFRKNIWSIDVINKFLHQENLEQIVDIYERLCPEGFLRDEIIETVKKPVTKQFYYSKKMNALLDYDIRLFNHAVFEFLKTTDYPVGRLDDFPLLDNMDVLVKDDIFRLLRESGVGVPAYYEEIPFEVDGETGTYCRNRSGCYFCFFQQKIGYGSTSSIQTSMQRRWSLRKTATPGTRTRALPTSSSRSVSVRSNSTSSAGRKRTVRKTRALRLWISLAMISCVRTALYRRLCCTR